MWSKIMICGAAACLPACLFGDFSYDQTTKITGGMMAGVMKFAGAFSKQAREPIQSTVAVKGNRMFHWNKDRGSIIDLDAETFTEINFLKKTYTVMTFAEMKQRAEAAIQQMKNQPPPPQAPSSNPTDPNVTTDFKMDVKETGQSRQISGLDTKEKVLTMTMDATDQKTGDQGGMMVISDMWIAQDVPGYREIGEFYQRMAAKMKNWAPDMSGMGGMGGAMAGRPDIAKAMANASREASKLGGVPVLVLMKMTPTVNGQPPAAPADSSAQSTPPPQSRPSSSSSSTPSLSGALAGRLGGFGGLGRKKKQDPPADSSSQTSQPPAQGADQSSGSLMESTTEMSNFSSGSIDPSRFAVPAGFKKVEPEAMRRAR